jgi:hypothetical protein
LDTFDATAARFREDAADAIGSKGRMDDVDVAGAATAAKSRAETVAVVDVIVDAVAVAVADDGAAATVAKYRADVAGAITARIDQNSLNSPAFK